VSGALDARGRSSAFVPGDCRLVSSDPPEIGPGGVGGCADTVALPIAMGLGCCPYSRPGVLIPRRECQNRDPDCKTVICFA